MTLKVGATPHSQWRVLTPLLEFLGWDSASGDDPESWDLHADVSPASSHLLLHTRPEVAVAHAIDAGQDPQDAINAWCSAVERMLAFYKRNRSATAVVDVCSAIRSPIACVEALSRHLDLKADGSMPELVDSGQISDRSRLKASELIAQRQDIVDLAAEVEASTLLLTNDAYPSPSVQIVELYKQLREAKPEEAEKQAEESARLLEALSTLESELEKERREHFETKAVLSDAQGENELLMEQLFKSQEDLERYLFEGRPTKGKRNRVNQLQSRNPWVSIGYIRRLINRLVKLRKANVRKYAQLLHQSEFFDADWYFRQYPDVAQSKHGAAAHYLRFGADEHRDPSSKFSTKRYLSAYRDVAESGMNPLVHYLLFGKDEGRSPKPK